VAAVCVLGLGLALGAVSPLVEGGLAR
jgi:hypothetical protein